MFSSIMKNIRKNILLALENHLSIKKIEDYFDSLDFFSSKNEVDSVLQILMVLS